jgi:peptidoglycan/LPS O-acetylase OafA/YrhL
MLVTKRRILNKETIQDFYFRRLKRILPEYLFVIAVVLLISTQRVSPIDYGQIVAETVPSLCFFSNWPAIHEHAYFDVVS